MDSSLRAEKIREGNRAFNEGDYPRARELFTQAEYKDGLIRIGDYYMYERRLPLLAYGYYKKAGDQKKIDDLHRRMIGALGTWLGKDKIREESRKKFGLNDGGGVMPEFSSELADAPAPELDYEAVDEDGMIPISVAPSLREVALSILEKRGG
ncbi:MAG: hypothetical protein NXI24_09410 [bacterium]|nr:hypothetical protein [bacterium]